MANNYNYSNSYQDDDPYSAPPPPPQHGMHPQSNFSRMHDQRSYNNTSQYQPQHQDYSDPRGPSRSPPSSARRPIAAPSLQPIDRNMSPSPPMHFNNMPAYPPPASRTPYQGQQNNSRGPSPQRQEQYQNDRRGQAVAGAAAGAGAGMAGAGMMHANNSTPGNMSQYSQQTPQEHEFDTQSNPYSNRAGMQSHDSYSSDAPFAAAAGTPGASTPRYPEPGFNNYHDYSPSPQRHLNPYTDQQIPTSRSHEQMMTAAAINPYDILDDGDDFPVHPKRASRVGVPFGNKSKSSVAVGAGVAGGAGAIGDDMAGRFNADTAYSAIPANRGGGAEKSGWMAAQTKNNKKWKKIMFIAVGILIIAGIAAGTAAGVITTQNSGDSSPSRGQSAAEDDANNGDLSKNSAEIKKLMNNPNMHKVFSGFAYTPLHAQYPDCLTFPPSQNNVTRDFALLSQLTNVVRLYGTDCNQTQMVLHAIDRLELPKDFKIWLGVWLGNNDTTNARQIEQAWTILDDYGTDHIKGVVVGNEVLFRKDMTNTQLGTYLAEFKTNLTNKNMDIPVATSDLGDNWTAELASEVDVVMSNVHPFFGGVTIDAAAGWTWDFWQNHDVAITAGMPSKSHVISEFGWPSSGGNDCGAATCTSDTQGAVASVPNMNKLMENWVCEAMSNGTDYFWFEAFDEPWKIRYNTADEQWEDKWGLMDVNRKLKSGVTIPDCGGTTVPPA